MNKTEDSRPGDQVQRTFNSRAQFARYPLEDYDMIRLNPWNSRKRLKTGKVVELGKAPRDAGWSTMPINSRKTLAECLRHGCGIGIRLRATQLVIDVDPRNGGCDSFPALTFDLGLDEDEWPRVITGSGGFHCYLSLPDGFAVQETLEGYPGIEFKSIGRQVVAAGSRHPNGRWYRWSKAHPPIEDGAPMAPTALLNAIRRPDRSNHTSGGGQYTVERFARALSRLKPCDFRDEFSWRTLMFASHHATAGEGEQAFVDFSAADPQFAGDSAQVVKRWRSCKESRPGAITYKTLNFILRKHGAADVIPPPDVGDDFDEVDIMEDVDASDIVGDDDRDLEVLGD